MDSTDCAVAIIGGSIDLGVKEWQLISVETPYGETPVTLFMGSMGGKDVAYLSRHGEGHTTPPHLINYRANLWALGKIGVKKIISTNAVGSLREELSPGKSVLIDQFIDLTKKRESTYSAIGDVRHVSMANPVCPVLGSCINVGIRGAICVVIDGPQFSTFAESMLYRQWGCDLIGMTNMPEAKLARELGICYAAVGLVTDYDCWRRQETVTYDIVKEVAKKGQMAMRKILTDAVQQIGDKSDTCTYCSEAA